MGLGLFFILGRVWKNPEGLWHRPKAGSTKELITEKVTGMTEGGNSTLDLTEECLDRGHCKAQW